MGRTFPVARAQGSPQRARGMDNQGGVAETEGGAVMGESSSQRVPAVESMRETAAELRAYIFSRRTHGKL